MSDMLNQNQKHKILVVDDEQDIREILQFNLEHEGYEVQTAPSAEDALEILNESFSLIILDVMMDGMSGFKMADLLRKEENLIPIIFLTAKNSENDMLTGFMLGGDDYIKKPFSVQELIARVKSVLKRYNIVVPEVESDDEFLSFGPIRINKKAKTVSDKNGIIDVTKTEYDILLLLASNIGRIFSRQEILDNVWQSDSIVLERTVDVHIARLRKKLGDYGNFIVNRVGFGYTFKLPKKNSK